MEMNEDVVKCTCTSAIPLTANPDSDLQKTIGDAMRAVQDTLNGFSDEVPVDDEEVSKAKGKLKGFTEYIKGDAFKNDINDMSKKLKIPPKKLANNFFEKALGTIGDILGIAFGTVRNAAHTVVDILGVIAHGAVNIVCNIADALARLVTLNKTCVA